jgi:hypothetical protein
VRFFSRNSFLFVTGGHFNLRVWSFDLPNRKPQLGGRRPRADVAGCPWPVSRSKDEESNNQTYALYCCAEQFNVIVRQ